MFDLMKRNTPAVAASNRNGGSIQLLTFRVDDREYALNLTNVVQIVRIIAMAHASQAPDSVEGMFNLRGRNIPVVDVRKECGLPTKPCGLNTPLVITRTNGHVLALTVDAVSEVLTMPVSSIEMCEPAAPETAHVIGVGRIADHPVFILDPDTLWAEQAN